MELCALRLSIRGVVEAWLGHAVIARWREIDFQYKHFGDAVTKRKSSCCLRMSFHSFLRV